MKIDKAKAAKEKKVKTTYQALLTGAEDLKKMRSHHEPESNEYKAYTQEINQRTVESDRLYCLNFSKFAFFHERDRSHRIEQLPKGQIQIKDAFAAQIIEAGKENAPFRINHF